MVFEFMPLYLEGAYVIENFAAADGRGEFQKNFEKRIFLDHGIDFKLSESFFSKSARNVIRGLHFQLCHPQAKLVTVLYGRVWDVMVDLRIGSRTYKKWAGIELSRENHRSLYIPKGFGHGFASLEENSMMLYQCDGKFDKETDTGILFNDPDIGIEWPVDESLAIHSERDLMLMGISEYERNPMET